MVAFIRNISAAIDTVLDVVRHVAFDPARARLSLMMEDLDGWLTRHHTSISQLVRQLFVGVASAMVLGGLVSLLGLGVGSVIQGSEDAARALVIIGMMIGLIGFAPLAILLILRRTLYDLIFHTAKTLSKLLHKEPADMPERIHAHLKEMEEAKEFPATPHTILMCYVAANMLMALMPMLSTIVYLVMASGFGLITYNLRHMLNVKGWALGHFCYALAVSAMWFATPAYLVAKWVNSIPKVSGLYADPSYKFLVQFGFALLVLVIVVFPMFRATHTDDSDKALDKGDVRRIEFINKPVGRDSNGNTIYEIYQRKPLSLGWIRPLLFFGLPLGGWFVWTQVLGRPLFGGVSFLGIVAFVAVFAVLLIAYAIMFGKPSAPKTAPAPASQGGQE